MQPPNIRLDDQTQHAIRQGVREAGRRDTRTVREGAERDGSAEQRGTGQPEACKPCEPASGIGKAATAPVIGIGPRQRAARGDLPIGRAVNRLRLRLPKEPHQPMKFWDAADFAGRPDAAAAT